MCDFDNIARKKTPTTYIILNCMSNACQVVVSAVFVWFFFYYSCRIFHRAYVAESSKLWIHQSVVTLPVLKIKLKDRCR